MKISDFLGWSHFIQIMMTWKILSMSNWIPHIYMESPNCFHDQYQSIIPPLVPEYDCFNFTGCWATPGYIWFAYPNFMWTSEKCIGFQKAEIEQGIPLEPYARMETKEEYRAQAKGTQTVKNKAYPLEFEHWWDSVLIWYWHFVCV